jgi:predicted permease
MLSAPHRPSPRLPLFAAAIFRTLVPIAEREEVLEDLRAEFARHLEEHGRAAARRWLWREALGSLPPLVRRLWWRGMTGFEARANRMQPGGPMVESWIVDFRYALRRLMRRPAYALLAVLTLALGAGGTAAIFSVTRALLLEPLPIAHEDHVGVFYFPYSWNESEFLYLRGKFPGFRDVAAYRGDNATLERDGAPLQFLEGMAVTAEFFDVLGARAMLGRTFKPGDDAAGAEPTSVLSQSLWQELGADPAIVGRQLRLGGVNRTVVGVMPKNFWYPSPTTRVWNSTPLDPQSRSGRYSLIGRVADGASIAHMDGPLRAIADALGRQYRYSPQWDKTKSPYITPVREYLVGNVSPSVKATLAAMAVILLIACANVAALMLGQVDARATELAVRSALGANRQRLVQQLASESIAIGLLAGITGALLAYAGFAVLVQSLPLGDLADNAHLDWTVFWTSMLAALAAAAIVAFVAGIALWRGSSLQATMATTRTGGVRGRGGRLEASLVVAQMALAVLVAAGAGLLIRSVANLRAIDPGIDTHNVVAIDAAMPARLTLDEQRRAVLDMVRTLQALPGVKSAGVTEKLPLRGSGYNFGIGIRSKPDAGGTTAFRIVSGDYFTTLGMPIAKGRNFEIQDRQGSDRVVVVNEALVAKYFPNENPIGQVLQTFDRSGERIIGVVANAAEANLTDAPVPARYMIYDQLPVAIGNQVTFVLKADAPTSVPAVLETARSTIQRTGSQLAVQKSMTMNGVFDLALGPTAQIVTLLTLLAGLALLLGAVGVYGVMTHYVTRRSRDYGVCIALGQLPSGIVRQVVGRGAALVAVGGTIGITAAIAATKVLSTLLFGVTATDPVSLASAIVVLLAVGILAAFVPARRASLTDPAVILRQ